MLSMPRIVRPDLLLVPPLNRELAGLLSETKNWRKLLSEKSTRQISRPAYLPFSRQNPTCL